MKMLHADTSWFDPERSIAARTGGETGRVLQTIAARYRASNPPTPFQFRVYHTDAFSCTGDGRFDIDLAARLPSAEYGNAALAAARFRKEEGGEHLFRISCYGPAAVYLNGEMVWRSTVRQDVNAAVVTSVPLPCRAGWNDLVLYCTRQASGFGCRIGPDEPRWFWLSMLAPFLGRRGQGGFVYSEDFAPDRGPDIAKLNLQDKEESTGIRWFPERVWPEERARRGCFARLFGERRGQWACADTFVELNVSGLLPYTLRFAGQDGESTVTIGGRKVKNGETLMLRGGRHKVRVISRCRGEDWGFRLELLDEEGRPAPFGQPGNLHGLPTPWIYLGPLAERPELKPEMEMYALYGEEEGGRYWVCDEPNAVLRPYLENRRFARWNYPLGVTLYGLTRTARLLGDDALLGYIREHVGACVELHAYSLWDAGRYGYPEINNQLVGLGMLDDCGSFGSAMLELYSGDVPPAARRAADRIAAYMSKGQERRPDGAFYRACPGHFMEDTLWVDDLYMSVPFLCRYYRLTGDGACLDDAARQVLLFRSYLYMPEQRVMSHVYDFKCGVPTRMPWGRGNGWCLFTLSELLAFLPERHPNRAEIRAFFEELCGGYLALQSPSGLWHQLLTHPDSYLETSCTAMFVYAFSRAVRFGWVNETFGRKLYDSAAKGWQGLCRKSIDEEGNIYGVCGGSAYSFSPDYYKRELLPVFNDTHGTGIVLLAGIEYAKMLRMGSAGRFGEEAETHP